MHALMSTQDVSVETDKQGRPRVRYEKGGGLTSGSPKWSCLPLRRADLAASSWTPQPVAGGCPVAVLVVTQQRGQHASTHPCACAMHLPHTHLPMSMHPCRLELLGVAGPQGALHQSRDTGADKTWHRAPFHAAICRTAAYTTCPWLCAMQLCSKCY